MNQNLMALAMLKERGAAGLTPLDALQSFGSFRLAARIYDLRQLGYVIDETTETRGGKRYARYVLRQEPEQLPIFSPTESFDSPSSGLEVGGVTPFSPNTSPAARGAATASR